MGFPVLSAEKFGPDCPPTVPWDFLRHHEQQAHRNHFQTLNCLAERGGLSPGEMVAVLLDRSWEKMPDADAIRELNRLLAEWTS